VKKNINHLKELAALNALGALDGDDLRSFVDQLAANPDARAEADSFAPVVEALARALPRGPIPSPSLKERVLRQAEASRARSKAEAELKKLTPPSQAGLAFMRDTGNRPWSPLPVAGAFVKLLSFDKDSGYAVVLGKLDPGARYPSHTHTHPEDIFMLSGDLHVGEQVMRAGDFHHADAGSRHDINWSEAGCVLLAVLSKEDLLNQLVPVA
jgi:anti-sigma factor ChrR (cupin superfamily)